MGPVWVVTGALGHSSAANAGAGVLACRPRPQPPSLPLLIAVQVREDPAGGQEETQDTGGEPDGHVHGPGLVLQRLGMDLRAALGAAAA